MMIALQLMKGLDKLGIPYRYNDYIYAKNNPHELIGVIGKPQLIFQKRFKNPILFGAGVYSHPIECPDLFEAFPNIKKILVPGEWMQKMFEPYYKNNVLVWPTGIDTEKWNPEIKKPEQCDFLIYDKIRWEHEVFEDSLIKPIIQELEVLKLSYIIIKYGSYKPHELMENLAICSSAIFLCEHETQGQAYQQILATNTPILAWDRGGYWQDPYYFPNKVKYSPVSSVPYWDERCGMKFDDRQAFKTRLQEFIEFKKMGKFNPRSFVLENLSLEHCAKNYEMIYKEIASAL
jgi:glycosyltransferase involved in cell wall biosynthesis